MQYHITEAIDGYRVDIVPQDFGAKILRYNPETRLEALKIVLNNLLTEVAEERKKLVKFSMEVI